jgi:phosphoribosyl-AMP cyclohydrolase
MTEAAPIEETLAFTPRYDRDGLIPALVTDARSGLPLMFAHMNATALERTMATGEVHFWSRSRGTLWKKGETSGNVLRVVSIYTDCDQDALWVSAGLEGAAACHTGRKSCFYRRVIATNGEYRLQFVTMAVNAD